MTDIAAAYERYHRELLAYVRRLTGGHPDSEDLVMQVWVQACQAADRDLRRSWFYTVARCRVIDWRRYHDRRPTAELTDVPGTDVADAVIGSLAARQALAGLYPAYRQVLWLVAGGWQHQEIAERMGRSAWGVKALAHRAREAARDHIDFPAWR